MQRDLFLHIVEVLENHLVYFHMKCDVHGKRGFKPLTKCTASMGMVAYGITVDCVDKYLKIGASTALQCIKKFTLGIIEVFGEE